MVWHWWDDYACGLDLDSKLSSGIFKVLSLLKRERVEIRNVIAIMTLGKLELVESLEEIKGLWTTIGINSVLNILNLLHHLGFNVVTEHLQFHLKPVLEG